MNVIEYLLTPAAQIALIIGLAEVIKRSGVETRWIPLFDLGMGLISGICVYGLAMNYGVVNGAVLGVAMGLSACGLFSGIKNVTARADFQVDLQSTVNNDAVLELLEGTEVYNVYDADNKAEE